MDPVPLGRGRREKVSVIRSLHVETHPPCLAGRASRGDEGTTDDRPSSNKRKRLPDIRDNSTLRSKPDSRSSISRAIFWYRLLLYHRPFETEHATPGLVVR